MATAIKMFAMLLTLKTIYNFLQTRRDGLQRQALLWGNTGPCAVLVALSARHELCALPHREEVMTERKSR